MTKIKGKAYAPADYLAKIDEPEPASPYSFLGLIKASESPDTLLYAHPGSCKRWVEISFDHIDLIEHLGEQQCGDHRHAVARVHFQQPQSAEHSALLALASLHHDMAVTALPSGPCAVLCGGCPAGQHPCYNGSVWTCCNDTPVG